MDSDNDGLGHWGKSSRDTGERKFLAGPRSRFGELLRALRIFGEFIKGFRALHFLPPCVTVFGSARFDQDNRWYQLARQVATELAKADFTIMTGGGPGSSPLWSSLAPPGRGSG